MKTISGTLLTLARKHATRFATLVKLTPVVGSVLYFTDSDKDITYSGHVYSSKHGCDTSQVRTALGMSSESASISTLIKPTGITGAMIEAGTLDDARCSIDLIDFSNIGAGSISLFVGFVVQATYVDRQTAQLDLQPWSQRGKQLASEVYSSNCRADFGDARCKVDLTDKQAASTITDAGNGQRFFVADRSADDRWNAGLIRFTSGVLNGYAMEIADYNADGTIIVRGLLPLLPDVGDTVQLYQGCDKTPARCTQYGNILNFRGEPFTIAPWIKTAAYQGSTDTSQQSGGGGSSGPVLNGMWLIQGWAYQDSGGWHQDPSWFFTKRYKLSINTAPYNMRFGPKNEWPGGAITAMGSGDNAYYVVNPDSIPDAHKAVITSQAVAYLNGASYHAPYFDVDGGTFHVVMSGILNLFGPVHNETIAALGVDLNKVADAIT